MAEYKLPLVPQRITPGFVFSNVERALCDCLSRRQFGKKEIAEVLAFFNTDPVECVFCGNLDVKRWDHLVPIKKGGETVIGNIVPACAACDDSKRDKLFEEWIFSDVLGSPKSRGIKDINKRIKKIKAYVHHFGYTPSSLEERLNSQEKVKLGEIRSSLKEVRDNMEELIRSYRARTGHI